MDINLNTLKGIVIVFWNIRSIVRKIDIVREYLCKNDIEVLCISETWLKEYIPNDQIYCKGYNLVRLDRSRENRNVRGGGLCIYIKDKLKFTHCLDDTYNMSTPDIELQTIKILLPNTRPIFVSNIYRPPDGKLDLFLNKLNELCISLDRLSRVDIFLGGDFNIDYSVPGGPRKALKDLEKRLDFKQLIQKPTRPLYNTAILDLIFTNSKELGVSGILDFNVSDHCPVFIQRKRLKAKMIKESFAGRTYKNYSFDKLVTELNNSDFSSFNGELQEQTLSINELWNRVYSIIKHAADKLCPLRTSFYSKDKPPWLSKELIEISRDKDLALKHARKTGKTVDKENAKVLRNRSNSAFRLARRRYILDNLNNNSDDPKKFWQSICEILPKTKSSSLLNLLKSDTNEPISAELVAEHINNFFAQVGPLLANAIPTTILNPTYALNDDLVGTNDDPGVFPNEAHLDNIACTIPLMTLDDLLKQIRVISIYKSSGLHDISSRLLKDFCLIKPDILLYIINMSITHSIFPNAWKHALVTPIPKVPNANVVEDLRPISLLPIPGKILERHIHSILMTFLEGNNLLSTYQNGFRKKHGTIDTVFKFLMTLTQNLNNKLPTLSLFIDFKKAFDTISHKLLINKLSHFNLAKNTITWIENYLTDRSQSTFANGISSSRVTLTYGVPQGSILGPLLFLLYVNDLPKLSINSEITLYADDTVLTCADINVNNVFIKIQSDLVNVKRWCDKNKLTINVKKTKVVLFNTKPDQRIGLPAIILSGQQLELVNNYKYLGITIDNNLDMYSHIDNMYRMASDKLRLLRSIRNFLTTKASLLITKTMVLPYLDLGNCFLTGVKQKETDRMEVLLNTSLRLAYLIRKPIDISRYKLHCQSRILPLSYRRKYFLLTTLYRLIQNGCISLKATMRDTRYNTGPVIDFDVPHTTRCQKLPYYTAAILWNSLPVESRLSPSIDNFKNIIKNMLLEQYHLDNVNS